MTRYDSFPRLGSLSTYAYKLLRGEIENLNLLELSHKKFEGGAGAKPGNGASYAYWKRIEIAREAKDQEIKDLRCL